MEEYSREKELLQEIQALKEELSKYEQLTSAVLGAEVWDYSIYEEIPDDDWLAIDRQDFEQIMQHIHGLVRMKPWKSSMEKRLEHYR
ncbi:hypothetical protein [Niallia endozanthoxylica]|uniref:Uncharacterized protein n=1 Tax=Niallia endozanthoxylica TaxID=2036016 RepID=A0A5J5HXW2_9BACI|nr:hypothetical protein [Niallia endozanthoxylica]KAA9026984.1 hypothetical protein F4V44_06595 [Niallia endozanthoxylica]